MMKRNLSAVTCGQSRSTKSRVHGVVDRRRRGWQQRRVAQEDAIGAVCMQSLFPTPFFRFFIVVENAGDQTSSSTPSHRHSHRSSEASDIPLPSRGLNEVSAQLHEDYTAAQEALAAVSQRLPAVEHAS